MAMTPAPNSLVIPLLTSPKLAQLPGMRFASVKPSQLPPSSLTVAMAPVTRGVMPWNTEWPIGSDQLDTPTLLKQPRAVAPMMDVRLMDGSGRVPNDASHQWRPRVSTADVRSSTVQDGVEWTPTSLTSLNDDCPSMQSELAETGDAQPQHQHYRENDLYRAFTPRHAAFDAMEARSNYRRLRTAGGLADFGDPWTHANADAMLSRPTTTEQLAGADSTTSISSSSTLRTLTSYSERRSRVSRISSRSTAASAAARLGLATARGSRCSEDVVVSCQRLGTSGSVVPLNSKGELRQKITTTDGGNLVSPLQTLVALVAPSPSMLSRAPVEAARGGKYREKLCVGGPSRGFRVAGLHDHVVR